MSTVRNGNGIPSAASGGHDALDHLWVGAVGTVLALMPGAILSYDQHVFPKELVLHVFACTAAVLALLGARRLRIGAVDALLAGFLVLGAVSTAAAGNGWFALRGFSLTLSGLVVFWTARALTGGGMRGELVKVVAVAAVAAAATGVLEAYGVLPGLSSTGRAPGGTIGNRNRLAHLLAIALPVLVLCAAGARSRLRFAGGAAGLFLVSAALVLTRARAAWVAVAAVGVLAAVLLAAGGWSALRARLPRRRVAGLAAAALAGVAAALLLPNRLSWRSDSPYLDTLRTVADYDSGSGRGRLIQYRNTLRLVAESPVLGVGPGNWSVEYPRFASAGDPSFTPETRLPVTRLPQGDWIGLAAERGLPALALLVLAGALVARRSWRRLREGGPGAAGDLALLLSMGALGTVGLFDPVLLTPASTFVFFLALGALAAPEPRAVDLPLGSAGRMAGVAAVLLLSAAPVLYSGRQLWAGYLYGTRADPGRLARATALNPGDYRAHLLLAEARIQAGRCDLARASIDAALGLIPTAPAPRKLWERCTAPGGRGV
ncbi:MAG TPA: tetratricopeptide repeat protein [Longimicrobiaceae bacterium]